MLADLTADRELLAAEPVIPDPVLADVRSAVHRRIAQEHRRRWRYGDVAVAAVLLFVLYKLPVRQPEPVAYTRPTLQAGPAVRPEVPEPVASTKHVVHRKFHRRCHPTRDSGALIDGQVVIRKQTADPNVVILLVGEAETGGGDE